MKRLVLLWLLTVLVASPAIAGEAVLSWDPPTTNTDGSWLTDLGGYRLYYGTASGNYGSVIDAGNVITHTVTELSGGTYYFAVTAYDTSGNESGFSNEVSKTFTSVTIPAPNALQAVGIGGTITLSWDKPDFTDIAGYQTSRGTSPGLYNAFYDVGAAQASSASCVVSYSGCVRKQYIWYNIAPGTYYFTVRAYDSQGNSGAYAGAVNTTLSGDAILPADVTSFNAAKLSDTSIRLTWTNPSDPDFSGLKIEYAFNSATNFVQLISSLKGYPSAQQAYNHYNLMPGTYNYRIHTYDTSGNMTNTEYSSLKLAKEQAGQETTAQQTSSREPTQKREKASTGFGCGTINSDNNGKGGDGNMDASILTLATIALLFKLRNRKPLATALACLCLLTIFLTPQHSDAGTIAVPLEYSSSGGHRIHIISPKNNYSAIYYIDGTAKMEYLDEANEQCAMQYGIVHPSKFTLYGLPPGEYYITIGKPYEANTPLNMIKRTIKQSRDPAGIVTSSHSGTIKITWNHPPDIQSARSEIKYSYQGGPFVNGGTLTGGGGRNRYTIINKPPGKYVYRIIFLDHQDIIVGIAETIIIVK